MIFRRIIIPASLVMSAMLLCSASSSAWPHRDKKPKAAVSAVEVADTSDATFKKDVLESKEPVLVDFYATWCGPCRAMSPVVDRLANQYKKQIKVFRMDVDKNPKISQQLNIESIPLFVIYKDGKQVNSAIGLQPKEDLAAMIQKSIAL